MAIVIGLDEAGYGPTLGPLVLAATRFRLPDPPPKDLWRILERSVCRGPRPGRDRRIPIADSKALFHAQKGIRDLEEAVLAAAHAAFAADGGEHDDGDELTALARSLGISGGAPGRGEGPWYAAEPIAIPLEADLLTLRPKGRRLADDLADAGGAFLGASLAVVEPDEFNRLVREEGNKSVLLFAVWARIVRALLDDGPADAPPDEPTYIVADRHGGRKGYLPLLRRFLGDLAPERARETDTRSDYRLAGGKLWISFQVRADGRHLPVALASMFAKYVREARMASFNRYFCGRVPGLRPTSGYPTDARRFLRDLRPALPALSIAPDALIRCR